MTPYLSALIGGKLLLSAGVFSDRTASISPDSLIPSLIAAFVTRYSTKNKITNAISSIAMALVTSRSTSACKAFKSIFPPCSEAPTVDHS